MADAVKPAVAEEAFNILKSKTFWVSVLGIIYGLAGYFSGKLSVQDAVVPIQVALSAIFLRLGIQ